MKEFIKAICFIGGCLFFIPFLIVYGGGYQNEEILQKLAAQNSAAHHKREENSLIDEEKIISILAKEIPYNFEYEAIKAQAVVIRTYMTRRVLGIQNKGELIGYAEEEMKELWGEDFEHIYATYKEAVKDTENQIILYDSEPIEALYHRASSGMTRSAKDVYNVDVHYLQGVTSEKDKLTKQIELKKKDMVSMLIEVYPDLVVDEDNLENQMQIVEKDQSEYIKTIQIGNTIISGEEFRKILGLPSSNFKVFKQSDSLVFDVRGIGHGVGLSQNGANELAKEGKKYDEIISHYYTDVTIKNNQYKK